MDEPTTLLNYGRRRPDLEHHFWRNARSVVQVFQCEEHPTHFLAGGTTTDIRYLNRWMQQQDTFLIEEIENGEVQFVEENHADCLAFQLEPITLLFNKNKTPHASR